MSHTDNGIGELGPGISNIAVVVGGAPTQYYPGSLQFAIIISESTKPLLPGTDAEKPRLLAGSLLILSSRKGPDCSGLRGTREGTAGTSVPTAAGCWNHQGVQPELNLGSLYPKPSTTWVLSSIMHLL